MKVSNNKLNLWDSKYWVAINNFLLQKEETWMMGGWRQKTERGLQLNRETRVYWRKNKQRLWKIKVDKNRRAGSKG